MLCVKSVVLEATLCLCYDKTPLRDASIGVQCCRHVWPGTRALPSPQALSYIRQSRV